VDEEHLIRVEEFLEDARQKGAVIVRAGDDPVDRRAISTRLLLNVNENMAIMKEEIFGPLLPVLPYENLEDAIRYVRSNPAPLSVYVMSLHKSVIQLVLESTVSGSLVINETVNQFIADDAPYGGVGPSGMGRYHGREGFLALSNARTVMRRGRRFNIGKLVHPPYGGVFQRLIEYIFMR
jgi:coniferyl-aldehyde dehydrogenase